MKKLMSLLLSLSLIVVLLSGCASPGNDSSKPATPPENPTEQDSNTNIEVVTIDNYQKKTDYEKVPERVFVMGYEATQILLALGLKDKIVGVEPDHNSPEDALPEFQADIKTINITQPHCSLENILQTNPDFFYCRSYVLNKVAPYEDLTKNNIKVYVSRGTYLTDPTIEDIYEDILNIGKIFRVEERAREYVESLREREKTVTDSIAKDKEPVRVFVYDCGDKDVLTCGSGLENDIITRAGGTNIFGDIQQEFPMVNWEAITERDPQVIIINDYQGDGSESYEQKVKFLTENAALKNVAAVKNKRFVRLNLLWVFPGPQAIDAIETVHQGIQ